jgi:hypothetical protein
VPRPRKPNIYCPNCGQFTVATRLNWNELPGAREEASARELQMGPHSWAEEIHYFRRVRRCSECGELLNTAEVDEKLISELSRLRKMFRALREEADRAAKATAAIRKHLREPYG